MLMPQAERETQAPMGDDDQLSSAPIFEFKEGHAYNVEIVDYH
jgi:hypothetical protein